MIVNQTATETQPLERQIDLPVIIQFAFVACVALIGTPLFGVLHGKRYTYQWSSMLILAYFMEGVVRAWSERGPAQALALAEIVLSMVFFTAAISYARFTRALAK